MQVRFAGLSLANGRSLVFHNLNLEVPSGQIACFYGPTRSGKTSLLLATGGHIRPALGQIWLGETEVTARPAMARRLTGLGVIADFNPLFDNLTVRENLLAQAHLYRVAQPKKRVDRLLAEFDLERVAAGAAEELTQPEVLRAGLAMAMVHDPAVLLIDEPGHALTSAELAAQWPFLRRLQASGKTLLLASHSLWVARRSDLSVQLPQGKEVQADEFAALGLARPQATLA
jgi:ABC-type multidrug transport system ATPase subunit